MPILHVPKPVLVELLAHASSAARIANSLCEREDGVESLAGHVGALVRGLADLVRYERRPDGDECNMEALEELRQLMARADALASTTDEQIDHIVIGAEGDRRGFDRLAHLVELTAITVAAAVEASAKVIADAERASQVDRA